LKKKFWSVFVVTLITGTKFKNGTLLRQNMSVFDIIPVLRDRKQAKISFSKNRQDVFSTRYQP
jgi:hypothetical protein